MMLLIPIIYIFYDSENIFKMYIFQSWAGDNFLASRQRQRDNVISGAGAGAEERWFGSATLYHLYTSVYTIDK